MTKIRCVGGMLDGQEVEDRGETKIYQHGLKMLHIHHAYPKRKGFKVVDRLLTITEEYDRVGEEYICKAPFGGKLVIGDVEFMPDEGGGYMVYVDRAGKVSKEAPQL